MKLLFVCSGNICRSPMAACYFRHVVERERLDVVVDSAGTLGIEDHPAADEAIEAMAEIGLDLRDHRSKGLQAEMFDEADLVVAMSHRHLVRMAAEFPEGHGERYLIRAFEDGAAPDPNPADLEDPIGAPIDVYREQLGVISRCLDNLGEWLRRTG